jgi:hypothetical protein
MCSFYTGESILLSGLLTLLSENKSLFFRILSRKAYYNFFFLGKEKHIIISLNKSYSLLCRRKYDSRIR